MERQRYFKQIVSIEGTDMVDSIGVWYDNDNGEDLTYQYTYVIETGEEIEFPKCDMSIYPDDEEITEEEAKKIMKRGE